MVLLLTTTLVISIIALCALFGIKRWELSTGAVLWSTVRPKIGAFSHHILLWVESILPRLIYVYTKRWLRASRVAIHTLAAFSVLHLERLLERALAFVRQSTSAKPGTVEVSVFLREVSEYKRKILRTKQGRSRTIKEQ